MSYVCMSFDKPRCISWCSDWIEQCMQPWNLFTPVWASTDTSVLKTINFTVADFQSMYPAIHCNPLSVPLFLRISFMVADYLDTAACHACKAINPPQIEFCRIYAMSFSYTIWTYGALSCLQRHSYGAVQSSSISKITAKLYFPSTVCHSWLTCLSPKNRLIGAMLLVWSKAQLACRQEMYLKGRTAICIASLSFISSYPKQSFSAAIKPTELKTWGCIDEPIQSMFILSGFHLASKCHRGLRNHLSHLYSWWQPFIIQYRHGPWDVPGMAWKIYMLNYWRVLGLCIVHIAIARRSRCEMISLMRFCVPTDPQSLQNEKYTGQDEFTCRLGRNKSSYALARTRRPLRIRDHQCGSNRGISELS